MIFSVASRMTWRVAAPSRPLRCVVFIRSSADGLSRSNYAVAQFSASLGSLHDDADPAKIANPRVGRLSVTVALRISTQGGKIGARPRERMAGAQRDFLAGRDLGWSGEIAFAFKVPFGPDDLAGTGWSLDRR